MTVEELISRLREVPSHLEIIVHYDGDYEATISDVRIADPRDKRFRVIATTGEHAIIQVET